MHRNKILSIAVCILVVCALWMTFANLMMWLQEQAPESVRIIGTEYPEPDPALVEELEEYADSILDWDSIVARVPRLEGYEVRGGLSIRGRKGNPITITHDSPFLWLYTRSVAEDTPSRWSFTLNLGLYESEAALREQIRIIPLAGFEVQEDEGNVTTGFCDGSYNDMDGRERIILDAFAARQRIWVRFVVTTDLEGNPFAGREDLEELIELVRERLLDMPQTPRFIELLRSVLASIRSRLFFADSQY